MCNELLKKAVRFHFYGICGKNIYTTLQFPAPRITIYVQLVLKRTKQPEIIRCLVILARSNFPFAYNARFIPDPIELYAFKRDLGIRSFYACRQEKHIFHKSLHILRIEFCQSAFGCLAISARQIAAGFVHGLHD